jgi:hypothetical protein
MPNSFILLDLCYVSSPVLLFGIPELAGLGEWVVPRSRALSEVLPLGLLVVVFETTV